LGDSAWQVLQVHGPAAHAMLLRLTLRRDVADDLLHELFLRLAGRLRHADDAGAYIRRAAINLAMDWRRSQQREKRIQPPAERTSPDPAIAAEAAEDVERILNAAANLTDLERDAFLLRFVQQESYEAVGRMLNRTPHQARGLCHAALKRIRERL
jgi:RNA polymerase sigma factor (sigma-70 family)